MSDGGFDDDGGGMPPLTAAAATAAPPAATAPLPPPMRSTAAANTIARRSMTTSRAATGDAGLREGGIDLKFDNDLVAEAERVEREANQSRKRRHDGSDPDAEDEIDRVAASESAPALPGGSGSDGNDIMPYQPSAIGSSAAAAGSDAVVPYVEVDWGKRHRLAVDHMLAMQDHWGKLIHAELDGLSDIDRKNFGVLCHVLVTARDRNHILNFPDPRLIKVECKEATVNGIKYDPKPKMFYGRNPNEMKFWVGPMRFARHSQIRLGGSLADAFDSGVANPYETKHFRAAKYKVAGSIAQITPIDANGPDHQSHVLQAYRHWFCDAEKKLLEHLLTNYPSVVRKILAVYNTTKSQCWRHPSGAICMENIYRGKDKKTLISEGSAEERAIVLEQMWQGGGLSHIWTGKGDVEHTKKRPEEGYLMNAELHAFSKKMPDPKFPNDPSKAKYIGKVLSDEQVAASPLLQVLDSMGYRPVDLPIFGPNGDPLMTAAVIDKVTGEIKEPSRVIDITNFAPDLSKGPTFNVCVSFITKNEDAPARAGSGRAARPLPVSALPGIGLAFHAIQMLSQESSYAVVADVAPSTNNSSSRLEEFDLPPIPTLLGPPVAGVDPKIASELRAKHEYIADFARKNRASLLDPGKDEGFQALLAELRSPGFKPPAPRTPFTVASAAAATAPAKPDWNAALAASKQASVASAAAATPGGGVHPATTPARK